MTDLLGSKVKVEIIDGAIRISPDMEFAVVWRDDTTIEEALEFVAQLPADPLDLMWPRTLYARKMPAG